MSFMGNATWVTYGDGIHMACLEPEQLLRLTFMFKRPEDAGPEHACAKCGVLLRETPDP